MLELHRFEKFIDYLATCSFWDIELIVGFVVCWVVGKKDSFVLCRIFQKSGLGPPNGDRYAPFLEEEWNDDTALMVPGGEADDDLTNGDETHVEGNDVVQVLSYLSIGAFCKFDTQYRVIVFLNGFVSGSEFHIWRSLNLNHIWLFFFKNV